jgi:hypothetical protein
VHYWGSDKEITDDHVSPKLLLMGPYPDDLITEVSFWFKVNCTSSGTYVNSKGQTVKRPESCSGPPKGATAQCVDGTYSFSQSRRGTCSHHGGVAKWL